VKTSNEAADCFDTIPSKASTSKKYKATLVHKSKSLNGMGDATKVSETELFRVIDKATDDYIAKHLDEINHFVVDS